jgi:hypothetical protein
MLVLIPLLLAVAAHAQSEKSWTTDDTMHFAIHHENPGISLGDNNRIERIYESLHPDLWRLVPWMTQKKVSIYLYRGRESFLKGRFNPPPWSAGLLTESDGEKVLALYEPLDTTIIAHELTHLYFHTYFDEAQAQPPPWLDEGLSGMLQDEALTLLDPRDKGPVLRAPIPLQAFLKMRPERDTPAARVTLWYQQAHSLVRFLKRGHIETSFADFCQKLRDGEDLEAVLRGVYGYSDLAAFEQAWTKWRPKKAVGQLVDMQDR